MVRIQYPQMLRILPDRDTEATCDQRRHASVDLFWQACGTLPTAFAYVAGQQANAYHKPILYTVYRSWTVCVGIRVRSS